MTTKDKIEELVNEVAEHFEWFVTLTDAQKTATREILRHALTQAYNLALEEVREKMPQETPQADTEAKEIRLFGGDVVLSKDLMERAWEELKAEINGWNDCRSQVLALLASAKLKDHE